MSRADLIPISSVIVRRISAMGIDTSRILQRAGLAANLFQGGRARLNTEEFFSLWKAMIETVGTPEFGLRLGSEATPDQFDIVSIAAVHAANLKDAITKMARYKRLVCPEEISIHTSDEESAIEFAWPYSSLPAPSQLIDSCFAATLLIARHGTGKIVYPLRIEYARPTQNQEMFETHFGCPVKFDSATNKIVFATAILNIPFETFNPDLLAMLIPGLDEKLEKEQPNTINDMFLFSVREQIRIHMQGQKPSLELVAKSLALSARSLQRRLKDHSTHFQDLLDSVRREHAIKLLNETQLDTEEIAFLLGFEELNSFTRAFRIWEGISPLKHRQQSSIIKFNH